MKRITQNIDVAKKFAIKQMIKNLNISFFFLESFTNDQTNQDKCLNEREIIKDFANG